MENNLKFTTSGGDVISAVYLPNKNATYTILISHGNSEDLSHFLPFLNKFHSEGFAVFSYDYRGYGASTGRPTEKNAYQDVNAAYHFLVKQLHVSPNHIIAYRAGWKTQESIRVKTYKMLGLMIDGLGNLK